MIPSKRLPTLLSRMPPSIAPCLALLLSICWVTLALANEPIQPLPEPDLTNPIAVKIGERLFHDPRLSSNNEISCASCHDLAAGGDDNRPFSIGVNGAVGVVNSPTVFNSSLNFRQFWDGRAASLEEQIDGPIHASNEMNSSWPEVIAKLKSDVNYIGDFKKAFPGEGISEATVKRALAAFESSLLTPSRFDRYLKGDQGAISEAERQGYELFKQYGCIACHQGVNVGGNMLQVFGIMGDYFADRGNVTAADWGYFNVTGRQRDRHKFKVPSLRNVALTAPYFHDASAQTLAEAVTVMARYQLGRAIPASDRDAIIAFLNALTGLRFSQAQTAAAP